MLKRKWRHAGPDSSSSSRPPVEGTSTRSSSSGKKGRFPARKRSRRLDMLEKQVEEMKKGMKEQEGQNEELRNKVEEQGKEIKKLKKRMKKAPKQKPISLSPANPPPPGSVQEGNTKALKLRIEMKAYQRVYTNNKLVGDLENKIRISLIDPESGQTITSGTESSIKVHVVVLDGNFDKGDHEEWPPKEFDDKIIEGRSNKPQLLIGDLQVTLKEGVGFINNLRFMDNSKWIKGEKVRVGVHVPSGYYEGTRICEAFSEPMVVREKRGELNEKHYPPQSSDPVWRLEGIGKDGCKKLNDNGITSVEQFLQAYNRHEHILREILGRCMTSTRWNSLIEHAQTCPPDGKWLVYGDVRGEALLFNNFASLTAVAWNGIYRPIDSLSDNEKKAAEKLVKAAYEKWEHVTEYPGINSHHELVTSPPGNHDGIPVGMSSVTDGVTNSGVVAEQARTSQQFVSQETGWMNPLLAGCTTSSHNLPNGDNDDCFDTDELLDVLDHPEEH